MIWEYLNGHACELGCGRDLRDPAVWVCVSVFKREAQHYYGDSSVQKVAWERLRCVFEYVCRFLWTEPEIGKCIPYECLKLIMGGSCVKPEYVTLCLWMWMCKLHHLNSNMQQARWLACTYSSSRVLSYRKNSTKCPHSPSELCNKGLKQYPLR